jgi:rubrerythrin
MTERLDNRRELLRRAALGGGALTATGLLGPTLAAAQSTDDDDLRDYLVEATGLEQITVLAYGTAAEAKGTQPVVRQSLERFGAQEQAHADAWRSALDSLGFDAPDPPDDATDTGVFDDVEGLSDEAANQLTGLLDNLDGLSKPEELLRFLVELEQRQLRYYVGAAPALDSEDLATTSAEIAGCQAEHLVVLHQAEGDSPADAVKAASSAG